EVGYFGIIIPRWQGIELYTKIQQFSDLTGYIFYELHIIGFYFNRLHQFVTFENAAHIISVLVLVFLLFHRLYRIKYNICCRDPFINKIFTHGFFILIYLIMSLFENRAHAAEPSFPNNKI